MEKARKHRKLKSREKVKERPMQKNDRRYVEKKDFQKRILVGVDGLET